MKEVIVLIGNYGSGKTELALNFAFQAARAGKKVELIDLDMVNTYFRLTDRGNLIKSREIRLVSPNFVHSSVETLSLPAEVASGLQLAEQAADGVRLDAVELGEVVVGRPAVALRPGQGGHLGVEQLGAGREGVVIADAGREDLARMALDLAL